VLGWIRKNILKTIPMYALFTRDAILTKLHWLKFLK
jgi:hypothetical protein